MSHDPLLMSPESWTAPLEEKVRRLEDALRGMESVIVAFSAGVDSTYLAWTAHQVLGGRALAVTATSPAFPERELEDAVRLAGAFGFAHRVIRSQELANPDYANNPTSRCFHCKTELYGLLRELAAAEGYAHVLDGTNADDAGDFRPGRKAAEQKEVRSPLLDLGFTKAEIREASRRAGLPTAEKPAFACLASRFPYGVKITSEALAAVDRAEIFLRDQGFRQVRVRAHGDLARIELLAEDIPRATAPGLRERIHEAIREAGFPFVSIDLLGYRSGSLNEAILKVSPAAPPP